MQENEEVKGWLSMGVIGEISSVGSYEAIRDRVLKLWPMTVRINALSSMKFLLVFESLEERDEAMGDISPLWECFANIRF